MSKRVTLISEGPVHTRNDDGQHFQYRSLYDRITGDKELKSETTTNSKTIIFINP
jgi:hypothetical protein